MLEHIEHLGKRSYMNGMKSTYIAAAYINQL